MTIPLFENDDSKHLSQIVNNNSILRYSMLVINCNSYFKHKLC